MKHRKHKAKLERRRSAYEKLGKLLMKVESGYKRPGSLKK